MRLLVGSLAVCATFFAASPSPAQTQSRPDAVPEINTTGRGEIRVTPDRATVIISVETHASSAADASSSNSQITNATIKSVKAVTASGDAITTQSFSVTPDYDKGKPKGFGARNTIRVELHDISRIGAVIDASLAAGATQVSQVQFTSSQAADTRRRAMKLAVAEARLDAEALAEAGGGTVGRLLSIGSSSSGGVAYGRLESVVVTGLASSSGGYVPPPIMPDDLTISAIAMTRWEFIPRKTP